MGNIKKFEDFLDKMQGLLDNAKKQGHIIVRVEDIENTFPELKESESEDERVKRILYSITSKMGFHIHDIFTEEEFQCFDTWSNAWLEKQGNNLVKNGYTKNKDYIRYADRYSYEIWRKLMDNFKNIKDYHIGCNEVSDIVLNAIIDTFNWLEKGGDKNKVSKHVEAINEEKIDDANKVEPKDYNSIDPHFFKTTDEVECDSCIEKQGEQNLIMAKSPQLDEPKPTDKVEPKFNEGEWITIKV